MALSTEKGCLSCTAVLWYIIFLGCGVNYMIRSNINIAIVSMVKKRPSDGGAVASECYQSGLNATGDFTANETLHHLELTDDDDETRFDWDEEQQGVVMGAFFWLYWAMQMPAGMMAHRYGSKKVFGIGNLTLALTTLLVPLCASLDYRALVALRVFQGVCGGFCFPSLSYIISRWVPANERGKFMSAFMGTLNGPWCRRISCDYFIRYPVQELQRCAPVFSRDGKCCAFGLHCPSDRHTIVRHSETSTGNGGVQCSYGSRTLNIGDEVLAGQVRCVCEVPPFVTCIE